MVDNATVEIRSRLAQPPGCHATARASSPINDPHIEPRVLGRDGRCHTREPRPDNENIRIGTHVHRLVPPCVNDVRYRLCRNR